MSVTAEHPTPTFDLGAAMARSTETAFLPGTVGVVTGELLRYPAFWRSLSSLKSPPGSAVVYSSGLDLPTNRNRLVEASTGDWLFTLDDDAVLLPNTLLRLLKVLDEGPYDVVSAFALARTPPFPSLVFVDDPTLDPRPQMWVPDGRTGVMEIAACGLPATLIRRRVFEKLTPPYFRVGQVDPDHYHEDVEFCRRVREAGFRIAVDLDTPVGHTTPMVLWPGTDPTGAPCAALVGGGGTIIPVDTGALRRSPSANPALLGL